MAAVILAAAARPVVHAAEVTAEVILIAAASVTALVAIGAAALLVRYALRCRAMARRAVSSHAPVILRAAEARTEPRAIEAPRRSLADLKALAAEHGYDVIRRDPQD
jgi:hypothetical protein